MAVQPKKSTQSNLPESGSPQNQATKEPVDKNLGATAQDVADRAINEGRSLARQVKATAGDAFDNVTTKASEKLEEHKSNLAAGLTNVASGFREFGSTLENKGTENQVTRFTSELTNTAARKIDSAANYFESHDLNAMYRDMESLARRNPALFLGGAFALGFLAARFFKSSNPRRSSGTSGQQFHIPQNQPRMGGEAARGL
jgi:hypothetical protein